YHTEFINGGVINTAADDIKIDFENEHNQFGIITTCSPHPLPEGIKKQVLQQLKDNLYFVYIAYLAECPENHDEILSNSFENQLFSEGDEYHTLQYLRLAVLLLQLGSNPNKKKVALSVKDKVIRLTIDEYVDQLDDENKWDEGVAQEIKSKSKYAHLIDDQITSLITLLGVKLGWISIHRIQLECSNPKHVTMQIYLCEDVDHSSTKIDPQDAHCYNLKK
ncbi:MAG: hypothetical protein EZS28_031831, partial [Streblomastix strix]